MVLSYVQRDPRVHVRCVFVLAFQCGQTPYCNPLMIKVSWLLLDSEGRNLPSSLPRTSLDYDLVACGCAKRCS